MVASLDRSPDPAGHAELRINLTGVCDDTSARVFARQVSRELEVGPLRRVVVDTTNLEFDLQDQQQLYLAVSVVYVASTVSERFRIVDTAERKRRLMDLISAAK